MNRLRNEPERQLVSSFTNLQMAEWAISKVMNKNSSKIKAWTQSSSKIPLILNENVGRSAGYGISREKGFVTNLKYVQVVLVRKEYNGMPFYIATSYLTK
jgi:hypothetical protein